MTPPRPTAAEHELALRNEHERVLESAFEECCDICRALLFFHAKLVASEAALAESERKRERLEERVRRLRATMMTIDLTIADGENVSERHTREALERDDALAADPQRARARRPLLRRP